MRVGWQFEWLLYNGTALIDNVTYHPSGANVDLIDTVTYHPSGAVAAMDYGNGHEYASTLDSMLRPINVSTETTSLTAFDRDYTYTPRGQIEDITDNVDSSYSQSYLATAVAFCGYN